MAVTVYDKVESNPKDYNVMDAYQLFAEEECDGFVSVGGGSSHDAAKGARIVAAHDGRNINEFAGINMSEKLDNPPQIAINTTNGTGSETTPAYVITDTTSDNAPYKWVGFDRAATTTLAINDPMLMMTQPAEYVAYTGFDTLAHASECYVNRVQIHSAHCRRRWQAVRLVEENLREAYASPQQLQGDEQHDVGAVHGRPGVLVGAARHHPLALARRVRLLRRPPRAQQRRRHRARVDLQPPACPDRFADIADAMHATQAGDEPGRGRRRRGRGGHPPGPRLRDPRELAERARSTRSRGSARAGTRTRPTAIEPEDDVLDKMAAHMFDDLCTPANPRNVTPGDLQGDPARLRLRQHGQQGGRAARTAARRTAAPAPRCRAGHRGAAAGRGRGSGGAGPRRDRDAAGAQASEPG